ncbi:Conidial development fluffy [Fusarium acutatum]|uniref:Conidial development fluffy n=1 Tax=Fusarium acutatum TaxID=78861 RepID=A0A8H4JT95_9HYPO|nr:Conidial development fluffy [Fusarium acutatum]
MPYKTLLPAPDTSGDPGGQDQDTRVARRRRANRPNACENCRLKKARCDGKRPSCSKCEKWGTTCVYSVDHLGNVERELREHRDILEFLLSLPEDEALAAHRQLRSTSNLSDALSSLQGSMHGRLQPSGIRTAQAMSPPTSSGLEFELTVRHGMAYPTLFPLDLPSLSADPRLRPVQRSCQGLLLDGSSPSDTMSPSTSSSNEQSVPTPSTQSLERPRIKQEEDVAGPHREKYCDERLHQLQIGYWTGVSIDDEVAASAISLYLQGNHSIFGLFDPDLFIHDLVHRRHQYCSPFLVNALLAHACQAYSVIDEAVGALSQDFMRDAGVLWRAERSSDSLVNVAAILMLSVSCHLEQSSVSSNDLLDDGRAMAERLKLFGIPHTPENAASFDSLDPDTKRAMAHTAWGAYSYLTLNTFWVPTKPIAFPPMFPVPGRSNEDTIDERLAVHWPAHFIPDYAGKTFQALCELWTIMQEVIAVYFAHQGDATAASMRIPLAFVEAKYQKILTFTDSLPPEMSSIDPGDMPDHVLAFNILLHVAITHLFHTFIMDPSNQNLNPALLKSPKAALRASTNQLQRLILISRLYHPYAHSLSVLSSAVVHVSNTIIRDAALRNHSIQAPSLDKKHRRRGSNEEAHWHFYFLICLAACQDLGACFPVCEPIGKGLLAMAMRDGSMTAAEANRLMRALEAPKQVAPPNKDESGTFGSWVLDFDLEASKPGDGHIRNLAAQFEELSMHNEFTEGGDFVLE